MDEIRKSVNRLGERAARRNLGQALSSIQEENFQKKIRACSGLWAEKTVREGFRFDDFIEGLGERAQENEMAVLRNFYENTPDELSEMKEEYLNITADMLYGKNRYHFNELYGIAAFFYSCGLTGETKFVSQKIGSGIYELKSILDGAVSYIAIKNRDTRKMFKGTDSFAILYGGAAV